VEKYWRCVVSLLSQELGRFDRFIKLKPFWACQKMTFLAKKIRDDGSPELERLLWDGCHGQ
jgi:hypothetical protein